MAIIIEKQKKSINWSAILIIFVLIIIIGVVSYFLFFSKVPLIEKIPSPQLKAINQISQIQLNPQSITQNKIFQLLKSYIILNMPSSSMIGKSNPFVK